jgi:phosphoribosylglycinamide formyltransferase 1
MARRGRPVALIGEATPKMAKLDLGVLVSGSGTNLQAILDAVASGKLPAEVRVVISNRSDAYALERARRAGVPARVISHRDLDRAQFDARLVEALREAGATTVVLAGFMRVLTDIFLRAFPLRVINIHPALLPAFPGVDAQRQAVDYGVKIAGCTVHFVDGGTDTGPVIAQAAVPVRDEDTEESVRERILVMEHRLLVDVLTWLAEERITIVPGEGGARTKVVTRGAATAVFAVDGSS